MIRVAVLALVLAPADAAPAANDASAPRPDTQISFEMLLIQLHPDAERVISLEGDVLVRQVPLLADIPLIGELFDTPARRPFSILSADEVTIRRGDQSWRPMVGSKPDDAPFDVLIAPRLIANVNQAAWISVGQMVHYLDRTDDGCLVVRECDECFEGVRIGVTAGDASARHVEIEELSVEVSRVVDREKIDGVPLDVGRPVMASRVVEGSFAIAPDQIMVMRIADPDQEDEREPILMLLSVKVVP